MFCHDTIEFKVFWVCVNYRVIRAYLTAKNYFLVLVLFYSKNTNVAQHPKLWLPASHPSCKLTVREIAARGETALPSQFLAVLCLEILLLLHIVAGLLKKNELSLTFLLNMHLRLATGLASQKQPRIKPPLSYLTNFLNIHSRQIKFPENGRGYVIYEPTIAYWWSVLFQLKEKLILVHKLKGMSGMGSVWSDEQGMSIQLETQGQWNTLVQVHSFPAMTCFI